MISQIAYLKNGNQVSIRKIDFISNKIDTKIITLSELNKEDITCLFFQKDLLDDANTTEVISENSKYFALRDANDFNITNDNFEKLTFEQLTVIFTKVRQTWILQNNISLLESMSEIKTHLGQLWPNDRTTYFEELWFILKKNLGALNLRIIYNDMKSIGKNDDKNSLIQVSLEGERNPNPVEGGDLEKSLMQNYQEEFVTSFNVVEFIPAKGQLVLAGNIKKSPYLIMATIPEITRLQQAIIQNFISAL